MFCEKCGKENKEGMNFCEACGAPLTQPAGQEAVTEEKTQEQENMPNGAPAGEAPMGGTPMGGTPVNGAPMGGTPIGGTPMGGAPMNGAPMGGTPMGGAPMNGAPMGGAPMNGAPMNGMPMGGTPMSGAPMGGAPMNGMPMGGTPMGGAPMNGAPMGGAPMNGAPMNGAPMNGMPMGARPMQTGPVYQMPPMQAVPPAKPAKKKGGGVKILIILIVILLVVCAGILVFIGLNKRAKQAKIDGYLQSAEEKADDGDYESAIEDYVQVLDLDADNKQAVNDMTGVYVQWTDELVLQGRYEEALDVLENADSRAKKKTLEELKEEVEAAMTAPAGGSQWADADFTFVSETDGSVILSLGHTFRVNTYYEESYLSDYSGDHDTYYSTFATARGLEPGMTRDEYVSLYGLEEGYAVWEKYTGEDGEYTSFAEYTGQSADEIYEDSNVANVWLDIGYCMEGGEWRLLEDWEVRDIWFCDAPMGDYEEVVILSVNLYEDDRVYDISMEYFTYDDNWVTWQDWAE